MVRRRTINIPLFWKFFALSTVIIILFGIIARYELRNSLYNSLNSEIIQKEIALSKLCSEKSLNSLVYNDKIALLNTITSIKKSDSSILYIFILDKNKNIIVKNNDIKINRRLIEANTLKKFNFNTKVLKLKDKSILTVRDIVYPIMQGEIGTVRIGIDEQHIQNEINRTGTKIIILVVIFFFIGMLGSFIFSYLITHPVTKISTKAAEINFNDLENQDCTLSLKPIKIKKYEITDELTTLSITFSEMLFRLKESYKQLNETQQALVHTEKLASLGTLSAGIAHEINNPISGIINCAWNIAQRPENKERSVEYANLIIEAAEKVSVVIKEMLNYSRNDNIILKKIKLKEIIDSSIHLITHKLERSNIELVSHIPDNSEVNVSPVQVEQIFVNLMMNSMDSILEKQQKKPDFKGLIEINFESTKEKQIVYFKDNGVGIAPENKFKIFDPFFTSKDIGKGTGLGLSISFFIMKKLGGSIYLKHSDRNSTEFVIEFLKPN